MVEHENQMWKIKVLQCKMATPKNRINKREGLSLVHGLPFVIMSGRALENTFNNILFKQFFGLKTKETNKQKLKNVKVQFPVPIYFKFKITTFYQKMGWGQGRMFFSRS